MTDNQRMIAGRYQLGNLIGRGGMADVYQGVDTRLGRVVAIKLLKSDLANDPSFEARFRQEAQASARMAHPTIVRVYDAGEELSIDSNGNERRTPYIVMEYVAGGTLEPYTRPDNLLPLADIVEIIFKCSRALEFAQRIGIRSAARTTCVKPEGTGSLALGGVASGSTPHHADEYLRYVEGGKANSPLVQYLLAKVPEAVEPSAYDAEEVKLCFPISAPSGSLRKCDVTALEHLDVIELLQRNWVQPGTRRSNLEHNVSNTVVVRDHEWHAVQDRIFERREVFSGVALIGSFGDLDYPQAPFVAVRRGSTDPRAIAVNEKFDRLKAAWPVLDFSEVVEVVDQAAGTEVIACGGGACEI